MPTPEQIAERLTQLQHRGWNKPRHYSRRELYDQRLDHRLAVNAVNQMYAAGILPPLTEHVELRREDRE